MPHVDSRSRPSPRRDALLIASPLALALATMLHARDACAQADATLDPVVVTATRQAERSFDVPASVDTIPRRAIEQGQPMVNLSESLVRVPGILAQNRQNYAQDLQISSRGFGARATFGVRGLRLYQDDIPATMPDGQGQTGSFELLTAERIEVLRGPFSTLYGNASGGVISVFTESGTPEPQLTFRAGAGSYGAWTAGAKLTGIASGVGYVAAANQFATDGYREHSGASRTLGVAKLAFAPADATAVTLLATSQDQPESQDPLGLTRAQWEANPRQADPAATQYDTRKTVHQQQLGVAVDQRLGDATTLRVTGYGGRRLVRQYLAFAGDGPTSSGGVTDLDRTYSGASMKLFYRTTLAGRPLTLIGGVDYDRQDEQRRGYVNNNGQMGALRRDEDDVVSDTDVYAQLEWEFLPRFGLTAGVRNSNVRFDSRDAYITATNPDDSGNATYRNTTPVAGVTWHANEDLNVYATYGEGFETPTFAELAYRPVGTGLNLDLQPSTSRAIEVGAKAIVARRHRVNVALFDIDTDDEIAVSAATGGRTTYRNAGSTRRRGAELAWDGDWGAGLTSRIALAWLSAEFRSGLSTGNPATSIAAGARLPGVPANTAYGELAWTPPAWRWLNAAVEVSHVARLYVNDRNTDFAPAYTIGNVRVGVEHETGRVKLAAFARVNNVTDRRYIGSVIVGDTNGRYFESALPRNLFVGASVDVRL